MPQPHCSVLLHPLPEFWQLLLKSSLAMFCCLVLPQHTQLLFNLRVLSVHCLQSVWSGKVSQRT